MVTDKTLKHIKTPGKKYAGTPQYVAKETAFD